MSQDMKRLGKIAVVTALACIGVFAVLIGLTFLGIF